MRIVFYTLLATVIVLGSWMSIPAQLLFNPSVIEIRGSDIRVYRNFPMKDVFGMPRVRYSEIIRPIDGSTPCADQQEFRYRDNSLPYIEWNIDHWAARCLIGGQDFVYSIAWSPRLFDIIPLRPIEFEILVRYVNGVTKSYNNNLWKGRDNE